MFYYFSYASNMNMASLRAKGVVPAATEKAELSGWKLSFNVRHWFRHEGGVANIVPAGLDEKVIGLVHLIDDEHLAMLDAVESYGEGYDRTHVNLTTALGPINAVTYIGLPGYIDNNRLPTQRYINLIVEGAHSAEIDEDYISKISALTVQDAPSYPRFRAPTNLPTPPVFNEQTLALNPLYTALLDAVFDMQYARQDLHCVHSLLGGKDTSLFHLKRHDSSDGSETLKDIAEGNIPELAKQYLNAYLHEYNAEFRYVGIYQPNN